MRGDQPVVSAASLIVRASIRATNPNTVVSRFGSLPRVASALRARLVCRNDSPHRRAQRPRPARRPRDGARSRPSSRRRSPSDPAASRPTARQAAGRSPATTARAAWPPSTPRPANLVGGDSNGVADVFVYKRPSGFRAAGGTLRRVSVTNSGGQANGPSTNPSLDGRVLLGDGNAAPALRRVPVRGLEPEQRGPRQDLRHLRARSGAWPHQARLTRDRRRRDEPLHRRELQDRRLRGRRARLCRARWVAA